MRSVVLPAATLFLISAIAGCGPSGPEMVPVTGVVKLSTGPLPKAEIAGVTFEPADMGDRKLTASSGDIQPDGSFRLKNNEGDGVRPGDYKVAIRVWDSYATRKSLIDEKYDKGATSPIRVTVEPGKANHFEWTLDPKK